MASQREWESVVWHFLGDHLRNTDDEYIKDWIFSSLPSTETQEDRWSSAITKVYQQVRKFADEEKCDNDECVGYLLNGG